MTPTRMTAPITAKFKDEGMPRMNSQSCPDCLLPTAPASCYSASTAELVKLFGEVVHVLLLDDPRRYENLFGRRDHRAVAAEDLRHRLDRLVAELVGLLDDCALDGAFPDADERRVLLVEGDDLHLADLARVTHGAEDGRAVVGPEADHR